MTASKNAAGGRLAGGTHKNWVIDDVSADRETRCRCVEEMKGLLAKQNDHLCLSVRWTTDQTEVRMIPIVETEPVDADAKKRTKRRVLLPTYCPFCGMKYSKPKTARARDRKRRASA